MRDFAQATVDLSDGADIARVAAELRDADALVHAAGVLRVGPLGQLDHAGGELMSMKIVSILESTRPIASPIRNAYIDFSKMTLSLVAVVTDVVRDGRPVIGYGFNSNGRYGQGALMRERFFPRLLEADPAIAGRRRRHQPRPAPDLGHDVPQREAGRPRRALGRHRHHRHGGVGRRGQDRRPAAVPAAGRSLRQRHARTARCSSTPPAATTTRARTTAS
jgi:hypothetical protein